MEKSFPVGRAGGSMVPCKIVLQKDARIDQITATNPVWHEEYQKNIPIHKCVGFINDVYRVSIEFRVWDPIAIEEVVTECETKLRNMIALEDSINSHKAKTEETLTRLGFK